MLIAFAGKGTQRTMRCVFVVPFLLAAVCSGWEFEMCASGRALCHGKPENGIRVVLMDDDGCKLLDCIPKMLVNVKY